jgi:hypothetical protein
MLGLEFPIQIPAIVISPSMMFIAPGIHTREDGQLPLMSPWLIETPFEEYAQCLHTDRFIAMDAGGDESLPRISDPENGCE